MAGTNHPTINETAERRQVTILHADIVNSTALVEGLDPEEHMGIMQSYLDSCIAIIHEYHGVLSGYTGDGFEAYFGYPMAREDSAVDAVNAAIRVQAMLAEPDRRLPFKCRMGIATGRVVIDQPGIVDVGRNVLAFGTVPHLAARLEQSADPGRILVDKATMRLCTGRFAFSSIGPIRLKGFGHNLEAWEVRETLTPAKRFASSGLSPYVGREAEIQLLVSRWQSAAAGAGQAVLLIGEPGIGKSRLVYELQRALGKDSGSIFHFQCLSQFTSTPLHPWIQNVQRFAGILQTDSAETNLEKVADYLNGELGLSKEVTQICATLMGFARIDVTPKDYSPKNMSLRLHNELVEYLVSYSQTTPVFMIVEDVQWIDASTMNLVQSLLKLIDRQRMMIVMTCRPENVPAFTHPHMTSLSLPKLDTNSIEELITSLTSHSREPLDRPILDSIRLRSDGNPLFIEELTKHHMELAGPGPDLAMVNREQQIPDVLQGLLMARIDNAGRSKKIAQLASVIGKEFDRDVLVDLSEEQDEVVQQQLDELIDLRILQNSSHRRGVSYEFCHALLRDAIYSSLLNTTRCRLHARIADYFWHGDGAGQKAPSEIIAYHFECGDDYENAFHHWLIAGQHALHAGATEEAANLLARALKLSSAVEDAPHNLESLALMYSSYGVALNASRGIAADPIKYYRKAEELSTRLGHTESTLEALDWQFGLHFNAGELLASKIPSLKMKELGSGLNHTIATASGCQGLGMTEFMLGNFVEARAEFELGLSTARNCISSVHCYPSMSLSYLAWTLFVLGHEAEAKDCARRAVESARHESSHAVATALSNCSYVYQCMGSIEKLYELTEELVEHTKKYGEQMYLRRGMIIRGWAECIRNHEEGSIREIASHIDFLLEAKEEIEITFLLGLMAEIQIEFGRLIDAQKSLDKAIEIAHHNEERFYLAELYRLKGIVARMDPRRFASSQGEDYTAMALETARRQRAEAWLNRLSLMPQ